jgi:hypothetical protein
VIVIRQSFFGSKGGNPVVDCLMVIAQKFIEIFILHVAVTLWLRPTCVNGSRLRFTKD